MNIGLALIISIIAGLIYVAVPPDHPMLARFCDLCKWICLIAFAAFIWGNK